VLVAMVELPDTGSREPQPRAYVNALFLSSMARFGEGAIQAGQF